MAKSRFGQRGRNKRKKKRGSIGKISRSQSVTTYGPGALYELRTLNRGAVANSVIIAGIDQWPEDEMNPVPEPSLAASLGVDRFLMPPSAEEEDNSAPLPAYRFPEWLECSECNRIGHVNVHFDEVLDAPPDCAANDCNGYGIPTRLVVACFKGDTANRNSPGHIDNFPWIWWAHSQSSEGKCQDPEIYLRNKGKKAGISGLEVTCETCEASRGLGEVFDATSLQPIKCAGYRPWLGSKKDTDVCELCERPMRALLRGASNIYFPATASAISIPPLSSKIVQQIESRGSVTLRALKARQANNQPINREEYITDFRNGIPGFHRYGREEIGLAIDILLEAAENGGEKLTEIQQKIRERQALTNDHQEEDEGQLEDDFRNAVLTNIELQDTPFLRSHIGILAQVQRLREVRAIRGFQRVESSPVADSYTQQCAPLSLNSMNWLPAIETRGEGIYFEISQNKLAEWEKMPSVREHIQPLIDSFETHCHEQQIEPDPNLIAPGYLMIHTLSHLLIKQLSLECGYSSASIRERLYYSDNESESWCGVLLYTATASADGTLGGLVRQGEPENLNRMMLSALENSRWCSSDPLCIESEGQGVNALNLAACHACSLVSETSCEQRNILLDRSLLVGTLENREMGFFSSWLNQGD